MVNGPGKRGKLLSAPQGEERVRGAAAASGQVLPSQASSRAGNHESTACPLFRQECTADTTSRPNVPRDLAPTALFATAHAMPGDEYNCLLNALDHVPGQAPTRVEASSPCAYTGQHVMGNLDAINSGSLGESFRERIARGPASTRPPTSEKYNEKRLPETLTRLFRSARESGFCQAC